MPHRPVFHLSCADFVSPVSPVSLAAKGFCLVVVFLVFVFFGLFGLLFGLGLFSVFCFLFPFASLHALALSLTGAQRTDSSSASKKKVILSKFHLHCGPLKFALHWTNVPFFESAFSAVSSRSIPKLTLRAEECTVLSWNLSIVDFFLCGSGSFRFCCGELLVGAFSW